jgi:four helix bundle protein
MDIKSYRDLKVWNKAIELVVEVYEISKKFPKSEIYALTSQVRRAVVSIPSNIAEGEQRKNIKEYIHFLSIAKGSNAEVQTQLYIASKLNYVSETDINKAMFLSDEINKMLTSLIKALSKS